EHTLTVSLQGNISDIDLVVDAGRSPTNLQVNNGFDDCMSTNVEPQRTICTVSATTATTWFVGVKAQNSERYSLLANVDESQAVARLTVQPGSIRAPLIPVNLQADTVAYDEVELQWDEANDEDAVVGYEVWRNGELHAYVDTASYEEKKLQPDTRYIYQVVAVDDQQNRSAISLPERVDTVANPIDDFDSHYNPENPTAPTNLRYIEYSPTVIELFWQPSYDNGVVATYEVYKNGELVHSGGGVSYLDDSIISDDSYTYRIVAVDDENNRSEPSGELSINPRAAIEDSEIKEGISDVVDVDGENAALLEGPQFDGTQTDTKSGAALWLLFLSALLFVCRLIPTGRQRSL
ncbi:hypothetical protein OAM69_07725, partial [bacterium]|nr:hypothetical protein [bacterium]